MKIDPSKCVGCHGCIAVCPMGAITPANDGKCQIDQSKCVSCGGCVPMCPMQAIS